MAETARQGKESHLPTHPSTTTVSMQTQEEPANRDSAVEGRVEPDKEKKAIFANPSIHYYCFETCNTDAIVINLLEPATQLTRK
ncbi:hypothetical protein CEXT_211271 [Caerostris extrusa]|uniref:Uncharacterized protein n=1 Tax=Caerostris extrusa TaxID=172846 RepID=A0AAV4NB44_CAEEX|nr:hypothetical protein CEXT_211271 [Caerostris extrusa]